MSTTYSTLSEALYDFMNALDISAAFPDEIEPMAWASHFNRPWKSDEVIYPGFAVLPARDAQAAADNRSDLDSITCSIYVLFQYWNADEAEEQIRALVDIVRSKLRNERIQPAPLDGACDGLSFTGEWGGDETQGQRFYRLDVTTQVVEDLSP